MFHPRRNSCGKCSVQKEKKDKNPKTIKNSMLLTAKTGSKTDKRAMMALGRSPEYHWNQIISNLSTGLAEEVI